MALPGCSGRSGAPRDVVHRASIATPPSGPGEPPKAGLFCAMATKRSLTDTPHRLRNRFVAMTQNHPGRAFPYEENVL